MNTTLPRPSRTATRVVLACAACALSGCKTYVARWEKLDPPYTAEQVAGTRDAWLHTRDGRMLRMKDPAWGTDEHGAYVEGRVERQRETLVFVDPVELVDLVGATVSGLSGSSRKEVERVHLADVRELRQETPAAPPPKWHQTAAVILWVAIYAALIVVAVG